MSDSEKLSYVKALMYIALADDKIDETEILYFNQVASLFALSNEQMDDLKESVLKKEESIESILSEIKERSTKLTLLYDLLALCYVDNRYSPLEKQGMRNICGIMQVETEKLEAMEETMEEQLALQRKINGILEREDV